MLPEEEQIRDLLKWLNEKNIPHLAIGGIAAILFGVERPTYDIDIAVPDDTSMIEAVLDIVKRLGYITVHKCPSPHDFLMGIDFVTAQFIKDKGCVEFRNEEKAYFPIDVLAVGKEKFEEISGGKIEIPFHGTFIICPNIDKLIEMKEEVGRPEDLEDVKKLKEIRDKLKNKYYE